ncbi:MAG TPA: triose-phosphate isomerase, partial [Bacteroidia bacterium]|nr:triose-phosphate isomerase [Bacteroidia bacterium]
NWKMNTSAAEAEELVNAIVRGLKENPAVEKIVFPPFTFLEAVNNIVALEDNFFTGAQNCSEFAKGAYTGEISAAMLCSVGCNYVLVGHSERRTYFKESSRQLVLKIEQALLHDVKVIFCFGEQLADRKNNSHFEVVKTQLEEVLSGFSTEKTDQLVLAYEPVWAIGTGETATPAQAQEMHAFVRKTLTSIFSEQIASEMPILYGGSCNAQNAKDLFSCPDVDGGLIGGASLKAEDFCKITESF